MGEGATEAVVGNEQSTNSRSTIPTADRMSPSLTSAANLMMPARPSNWRDVNPTWMPKTVTGWGL